MEIAGIQERDKVLERKKKSCTVDDQIFSAAHVAFKEQYNCLFFIQRY
jgi:hypothetical protein